MEDFYEHIDDYKDGLLTGEALAQFEAKMVSDASLKLAVDNYASAKSISEGLLEVDMMATLKGLKKENLQETAKNTETQNDSGKSKNHSPSISDRSLPNSSRTSINRAKTKTSIFNLRNLMAAASMIGIIFFAGWWMMGPTHDLDMEYVLANYQRPIDGDATKSADTVGMTDFEKGKYFFVLNRFEDGEKWLKKSIEKTANTKEKSIQYYWLGAAHLEQKEVQEAKKAWSMSHEEGVEQNLEFIK